MNVADFDYELPSHLIAQRPLEPRDASRLMVVERRGGQIAHRAWRDLIDLLRPGDVLVANDSRVIPARLFGRKSTGGQVELLLLKPAGPRRWEVLVGGKRVRVGTEIHLENPKSQIPNPKSKILKAVVVEAFEEGRRVVEFDRPLEPALEDLGQTPLPPYIHEPLADPERYQTVYARHSAQGSAAAPTAGLHFTPEMLLALREKGVLLEYVTLHIGLDTFKPVTVEQVAAHPIHREWARLSPEAARRINEAKLAGGRIVAVGTTSVRTLETAALRSAGQLGSLQGASALDAGVCPWKPVVAIEEETDLFIYPGYTFRAVDVMVTNFHLPKSTLLMLVSAFAGQDLIRRAYAEAIRAEYRFYSFGDAMLIL